MITDDIDITSDLTDGGDGYLADTLPQGANNSEPQAPEGTQSVHGDVQQRNAADNSQQKAEPSLRDQLSSAFKGADEKPTNQQDAATVAPTLTKDGEGKYRHIDGTYASAEQVAAFEAAQKQPVQQDQAQQPQSPVQGLTPAEQQQFQSLPAELRQFVERTMEDMNTRAARYGEYDLIEQVIGPRRQAFVAEGTTPAVAVQQLFAMSDFAGQNPGDFVLWFAQQRGLDLDALLDARDAQQQNVSPEVRALQGQVQQLSGTIQQFQQQGQQVAQQANIQQVEAFALERDATGALKRPYLNDVLDGFTAQITAVQRMQPNLSNAEVLERAYQNACWSDVNIRAKMQNAQNVQQQQERAAAAKRAGSSVTGAPAGGSNTTPNNANRTLREEIAEQFAAARA